MRRQIVVGLVALAIATVLGAPGAAAAAPRLVAMLDGRPIPLARVGRLHCHDLEYPIIRCYRSAALLEVAFARSIALRAVDARRAAGAGEEGLESLSYVRIFEHEDFEGASAYLATSYANLGTIGWNDRITSFRSVNSGAGTFYRHAQYSGTQLPFCCGDSVVNVGGDWNDQISSVTGSA